MTYQLWDGESSNLVFGSTLNIIGAKITVNGTFRINTSMTWSLCEVFLAKNAKISVMMGQQRVDLNSPFDLPEIPFRVVSIKADEKQSIPQPAHTGLYSH